MPGGAVLPVATVALFVLVMSLLVADYAVYRRLLQRLKDEHGERWQTLQRSSRWKLWRLLWGVDKYAADPSLGSLLRVYRVVTVAYAVAVAAWIVVGILALLPPTAF